MTRARRIAIVRIAFLLTGVLSTAAVQAQRLSQYKLLDAVVFYGTPPTAGYAADVLRQMRQFAQRANSYQPRPRPPKLGSEMTMVYAAREGYERKLVAAASASGSERLAQQYVDELRPCYEWEGFHDCPEREARFAEEHLAKNPNSPFAEFLRLLSAHRWVCTAEGYEREERPQDAVQARRSAEAPLAAALKAQSLLIRTAAQEQLARGRCHADVQ